MVAPVTGPFTSTENTRPGVWPNPLNPQVNSGQDTFRRVQSKYRQRRPYNLPLPYYLDESAVEVPSRVPSYDGCNSTGDMTSRTRPFLLNDPLIADLVLTAQRDAVKRFNGELKEAASWMVTLAERRQAIQMMESRLFQLVRFTRNVRRGRFGDAAKDLISKHDSAGWETYRRKQQEGRFRKGSKFFADNYLEFHFGWSPAVSDIYASIDILQRGVPAVYVKESGKATGDREVKPGGFSPTSSRHHSVVRYVVGASISVSNPNLWLANQLGLVNPALLLFETVPFSFVLDWFVNVSEFLGQFTEYWGLNVVDPWYQVSLQDQVRWTWAGFTNGGGRRLELRRTVGALPTVSLGIRKPWQLSVRRGLAAASLLVQLLK